MDSASVMQESELALQRLAGGLRELTAMRSDVAAEDSALLEQQLEQLHGQWEELCTKVSPANPRGRGRGRTKRVKDREEWGECRRRRGQLPQSRLDGDQSGKASAQLAIHTHTHICSSLSRRRNATFTLSLVSKFLRYPNNHLNP